MEEELHSPLTCVFYSNETTMNLEECENMTHIEICLFSKNLWLHPDAIKGLVIGALQPVTKEESLSFVFDF